MLFRLQGSTFPTLTAECCYWTCLWTNVSNPFSKITNAYMLSQRQQENQEVVSKHLQGLNLEHFFKAVELMLGHRLTSHDKGIHKKQKPDTKPQPQPANGEQCMKHQHSEYGHDFIAEAKAARSKVRPQQGLQDISFSLSHAGSTHLLATPW